MTGNRPPLGFSILTAFQLCVLALGVFLQNLRDRDPVWFWIALGVGVVLGGTWALVYRRFLLDVLVSRRSAALALGLALLAGLVPMVLVQEGALERRGIVERGFATRGRPPVYAAGTQSGAFGKHVAVVCLRATGGDTSDEFVEAWTAQHFDGLYRVWTFARMFRLFDVVTSWWFAFLLVLIGAHVVARTWERAPWTPRDLGHAVLAAAVVVLLGGLLVDRWVGHEGEIHFEHGRVAGRVESKFADAPNQRFVHLPFRLFLERVTAPHEHFVAVTHDGGETTFPAALGATHAVAGSEVVVHAFDPDPEGPDPRDVQARVRAALEIAELSGVDAGGPLVAVVVRAAEAAARGEAGADREAAAAVNAIDRMIAASGGRIEGFLDATLQASFDGARRGTDGPVSFAEADLEIRRGEASVRKTLRVGAEALTGADGVAVELVARIDDAAATRTLTVVSHEGHRVASASLSGDDVMERDGFRFAAWQTGVDPRDGRLVTTVRAYTHPARRLVLLGAAVLAIGVLWWSVTRGRFAVLESVFVALLVYACITAFRADARGAYTLWTEYEAAALPFAALILGGVELRSVEGWRGRRGVVALAVGFLVYLLAYLAH